MTILSQTLHQFNSGDTFVGAQLDGDSLVLGETRNEEQAAEGRFNLLTVIPLQHAIAIAKALLAAQEQAEMDAWIDEMYQRHLDRQAMEDDHLEHELQVEMTHWLQ